jgi:hypothetical protein
MHTLARDHHVTSEASRMPQNAQAALRRLNPFSTLEFSPVLRSDGCDRRDTDSLRSEGHSPVASR